jgi:hypothetical protein
MAAHRLLGHRACDVYHQHAKEASPKEQAPTNRQSPTMEQMTSRHNALISAAAAAAMNNIHPGLSWYSRWCSFVCCTQGYIMNKHQHQQQTTRGSKHNLCCVADNDTSCLPKQ